MTEVLQLGCHHQGQTVDREDELTCLRHVPNKGIWDFGNSFFSTMTITLEAMLLIRKELGIMPNSSPTISG